MGFIGQSPKFSTLPNLPTHLDNFQLSHPIPPFFCFHFSPNVKPMLNVKNGQISKSPILNSL